MDMTHPDILKIERDGFSGKERKAAMRCDVCGEDIYVGEEYCDMGDEAVCDGCWYEYKKQFRRVAG